MTKRTALLQAEVGQIVAECGRLDALREGNTVEVGRIAERIRRHCANIFNEMVEASQVGREREHRGKTLKHNPPISPISSAGSPRNPRTAKLMSLLGVYEQMRDEA
jgi:hypothetical protein